MSLENKKKCTEKFCFKQDKAPEYVASSCGSGAPLQADWCTYIPPWSREVSALHGGGCEGTDKVKQQSWTVRVVYEVGEISKKRREEKNNKEIKDKNRESKREFIRYILRAVFFQS
jgi:hypothetical protein